MKIIVIFLACIIVIGIAALLFIQAKQKSTDTQQPIIKKAQEIFEEKKKSGVLLGDGPCLSEELIPDWSFDIVHNPRQDIDNQPENQCQYFREGKTHHFIEFDQQGRLIRML
ncbi:hypothetical protein HYW55_06120 [Candidatus Gottesmanbacteria bacterium]|nr:hypothetical protein [Candidatus Gottesmanbacteria bacterium]